MNLFISFEKEAVSSNALFGVWQFKDRSHVGLSSRDLVCPEGEKRELQGKEELSLVPRESLAHTALTPRDSHCI